MKLEEGQKVKVGKGSEAYEAVVAGPSENPLLVKIDVISGRWTGSQLLAVEKTLKPIK